MARSTALPPSSTPLEQDLAQVAELDPTYAGPIEGFRGAKYFNIPDDYIPWLIYEYGLGELLPYLPNPRTAIATGIPWQRIRGTPKSLLIGLGWVGINARIEENPPTDFRWFEYQLEIDRIADEEIERDNIEGIARISQPARSKLARVYFDWDLRPARWDQTKWDGDFLWDDWSGFQLDPPDGPVWSFGRRIKSVIDIGSELDYSSLIISKALAVNYLDSPLIWDQMRWDEEVLVQVYTFGATQVAFVSEYADGPWPLVWGSEWAALPQVVQDVQVVP